MVPALQTFFEINAVPVLFVYGLVFFVLGLAIALQNRQRSRLELAGSLGWLAAFGFLHGLHEWGDIFIPMQAVYLSSQAIILLQYLQVILLVVSFGCLFQFGVELLTPRWPRLLIVPLLVVVGWGVWFILPGIAFSTDLHAWHFQASIWARYLIGFPGGVSAALGLRYQADRQIRPLKLTRIYRTLQVAGGAFLLYAILGGLIVPVGEFFPANWLNHENFTAWVGISPPVLRSLTGLVLAVSIIQALEVFNIENDRLIEHLEIEQNLLGERERIGRELHDSTIQTIYTAGLLVEAAHAKLSQPELAGQRLERAMETINEAIAGLRTYISGLQPDSAFLSLSEGIRHLVDDLRLTAVVNIQLEIDLPPEAHFQPSRCHHILAIVREGLTNATRHAQANSILVKVKNEKNTLIVSIADNGCGFSAAQGNRGNGLQNMRDRANLLGGQLRIDSRPGQGVTVALSVPWQKET